jgi:DNA-binding transcriptional regulator YiaG
VAWRPLRRTGALDKPVSVARRLFAAGLTLKQSHDAINKLAERSWTVCAVANTEDLRRLAADLASMNVELRQRLPTSDDAIDVAAMRVRHSLSQREYAAMLGIDVRTLQNWEQGRNRPDPAAVSLMRIFAYAPIYLRRPCQNRSCDPHDSLRGTLSDQLLLKCSAPSTVMRTCERWV